jgi:hypothetical protein
LCVSVASVCNRSGANESRLRLVLSLIDRFGQSVCSGCDVAMLRWSWFAGWLSNFEFFDANTIELLPGKQFLVAITVQDRFTATSQHPNPSQVKADLCRKYECCDECGWMPPHPARHFQHIQIHRSRPPGGYIHNIQNIRGYNLGSEGPLVVQCWYFTVRGSLWRSVVKMRVSLLNSAARLAVATAASPARAQRMLRIPPNNHTCFHSQHRHLRYLSSSSSNGTRHPPAVAVEDLGCSTGGLTARQQADIEELVLDTLREVRDTASHKDVVTLGCVQRLTVDRPDTELSLDPAQSSHAARVTFKLVMPAHLQGHTEQYADLKKRFFAALNGAPELRDLNIRVLVDKEPSAAAAASGSQSSSATKEQLSESTSNEQGSEQVSSWHCISVRGVVRLFQLAHELLLRGCIACYCSTYMWSSLLPVCLSVYSSVYLCICLSISLSVNMCVYQSVH